MEFGLLFLCIYFIKLKERWFTKIAVKVSDDVRNLCLFPSVWDTCSCWEKMQSGIFCITVISGYVCYAYLHTSWKGIFHCVCFMCSHGLYPDARAQQIPCSLYCAHLYLTGKKQSYSECMAYWDRRFSVRAWDTLHLWNFKVDCTITTGRKPMSSWNLKKKCEERLGCWAVWSGSVLCLLCEAEVLDIGVMCNCVSLVLWWMSLYMFYYIIHSWIYEMVIFFFQFWTDLNRNPLLMRTDGSASLIGR